MGISKFKDKVSSPATILGKDFTISGNIQGSGSIIISGQVKGDGEIEGMVELASTAVWEGNIHTDDVIIGGTVKGDVFARGKLEITGSARIFGNVSGTSVSVAQGAMIDGTMKIHDGKLPTGNVLEESDNKNSADIVSEPLPEASSY